MLKNANNIPVDTKKIGGELIKFPPPVCYI